MIFFLGFPQLYEKSSDSGNGIKSMSSYRHQEYFHNHRIKKEMPSADKKMGWAFPMKYERCEFFKKLDFFHMSNFFFMVV